jgi:Polyketide cyclase / dehydrase and lipid transport
MGGTLSCRIKQLSNAKPVVVYDVLMDVERWSDWMPTVSAASWELRGEPDTGKGGVRRVRNGISVTRDTIIGGARPNHHAYASSLPRFFPVTNYKGDVRIEEHPNGSNIVWTVTCASRIPGLGQPLLSGIRATYVRIAAALAQEAEGVARTK